MDLIHLRHVIGLKIGPRSDAVVNGAGCRESDKMLVLNNSDTKWFPLRTSHLPKSQVLEVF
jgi:hypothetical protein